MKLDAGLMTSLPASDPGSAAVWGSKRINPWPQPCMYLAWSGCPSNDDNDNDSKHADGVYGKLKRHDRELKVKQLKQQLKNQCFMFQKMHTDNEKTV